MSIQALAWVFSTEVRPSQTKLVLIALANYCNDNALAWPSVETICGVTSQNRKTVLRALKNLEAMNLITDTGKRSGKTWGVRVFRLAVPDTVLLKVRSSTTFTRKRYQPRPEAVPKTGHRTNKEPFLTKQPDEQRNNNISQIAEHLANLKKACK